MASEGGKTETNVQTEVEEFTDNEGNRVRRTTVTTTTTTTTRDGGKSTSTKKEIKTEYLKEPSHSGRDGEMRGVDKDFRDMKIKDGGDEPKKMSKREIQKFEEECIDRHNELRKKHGVPKLKRSAKLQEKAQNWAEHLVRKGQLEHRDENDLGENVAYKFSSDKRMFKGEEIADMWYDEIKDYDFSSPKFSSNTGHFTQVVWEDSKEIGVGVAIDGKGSLYAVANYLPAGNYRGKFENNVRRPRK